MTQAQTLWGSPVAMTITLASLASDTNLIAGRESTVVNSTASFAVDFLVGGTITASSTSATASRQIEIWAYGTYDGTSYSAGATGSDANFSPTGEKTLLKLLTIIPTDATSSHAYQWGPFSIAQAFGGVAPLSWGSYVVHNMGSALSATGANHEMEYIPVYYTSS